MSYRFDEEYDPGFDGREEYKDAAADAWPPSDKEIEDWQVELMPDDEDQYHYERDHEEW